MSKKAKVQKIYPLSPMQEGMLFHYLMDKQQDDYILQTVLVIEGELNRELFERSFNLVIERHEVLRSVFIHEKVQKPRQVVLENRDFKIRYLDAAVNGESGAVGLVEKIKADELTQGFDLSKDILMRVTVVKNGPAAYSVVWSYHHILMDGWCFGIIVAELLEVYKSLLKGMEPSLSAVPPVAKYIEWLEKQDKKGALGYWKKYLEDYENAASLPAASNAASGGHRERTFVLDERQTGMLASLSRKHKTTISTVFHAIWGILLQRYSNLDDVVFGSVVSGRPAGLDGVERMVGLFINTLPVRMQNGPGLNFCQVLSAVARSMVEAEQYSYVQLSEIQTQTEVKNNLFDHILVFENYPMDQSLRELDLGKDAGFRITGVEAYERTHYRLTVIIFPGQETTVKLVYDPSKLNDDFAGKIGGHFGRVLDAVSSNDQITVDSIDILTRDEKRSVLDDYNNTWAEYPRDKSIPQLFEEQAQRTPHHIAVTEEGRHLTYHELSERADHLAGKLTELGVKPGEVVAVMVERSLELIVGIMAVMKSGGAFLPIDSECPEDRLSFLLGDSGARVILTLEHLFDKIHFKGEILNLEDKSLYAGARRNPPAQCGPRDLLYIIYTSGTTGKPKAVMLEHRNMVNLVCYQYHKTNIDFTGNVLNFVAVNFDVCYQEIFSTLLAGGRLFVIDDSRKRDVKKLMGFIADNSISVAFFPTSFFIFLTGEQEYIDLLPSCIRHIITAGEQLIVRGSFGEHHKKNGLYLHNHYGPSETHVVSTYVVSPGSPAPELPPIGLPISNTRLYIMNRGMQLQPVGIPGELYISGDNVGRGYYRREELTREKYLPDPFFPDQRMYRTGDLVRRLTDGNIEYMGRIDSQVKIRGFRIELGEVESQLMAHPDIKDAVVLARKDQNGNKFLCTYVVAPKTLHVDEIRGFLSKELPDYMIPSHFVHIDKMPYRPNGKVDWHKLPECQVNLREEVEYVLPANVTEQRLADIWKEILLVGVVGVKDNFFELGGHSLKAMSLVSRINKEFSIDLPIRAVFKHPTVRDLSEYILKSKESAVASIEPYPIKDHYPLSSAQKRVFVLEQFEKNSTNYNMPALLLVEGELDRNKLENAFGTIISRHESLRTSFDMIDGVPVQKVQKKVPFVLEYLELDEGSIEKTAGGFIRPFDLAVPPLLRAELVKVSGHRHYLLCDLHHIISDGISLKLLVKELAQAYQGLDMEPLRLQYRDYACWQQDMLRSEGIIRQEQYWQRMFTGEIPVLELETDFRRPAVQSFEGNTLAFELEEKAYSAIKNMAAEQGATVYMALLAAWACLLFKYSGQQDLVIGSPIAGRRHADLTGIIGMFVNTLALRLRPEGGMTFLDFLDQVKQTMVGAYDNQDCQFEELVEKLGVPRDLSRNPLFDTMFSLQQSALEETETGGLKIQAVPLKNRSSKFDISLLGTEGARGVKLELEYSVKLFRPQTIGRIRDHFLGIIRQIIDDPSVKMSNISLADSGERELLLKDFCNGPQSGLEPRTIDRMFSEQAARTPDNVALICGQREVSYAELDGMTNRLARLLGDKGAGPEKIIALLVDRSVEMIAGILGVLKAGGAYLPIDPGLPEERIRLVIEDAGAVALLAGEGLSGKIKNGCPIVELIEPLLKAGNGADLGQTAAPENLAYVIYTSGSTGQPKGVMVEHRAIANTVGWRIKHYGFSADDVVMQIPSYSFDSSVEDILCPLLSGGKLVLIEPEKRLNTGHLERVINERGVTHFLITPGFYQTLLEGFVTRPGSLRMVTLAGEHFTPELVRKHFDKFPGVRLFNEYGPTENAVCSTVYEFDPSGVHLLIGRPVDNTRCYVLDPGNNLQPAGVKGELCLAGAGLARGYLNRPELTAQRFVPDPFGPGLMYRTGDLVRWSPDGNLEFMGRADGQIKIRGFRIELGEIETQLLNSGGIKQATVCARDDGKGSKSLCAYFVSENELPSGELRKRLAGMLPDYMVPQHFVRLPEIPLTARGKVDYKALPAPERDQGGQDDYVPPRNEAEEVIAGIWEDIFGVERIGINDNFFSLGGHSLKAIQLANRIRQELGAEVELSQLFLHPTIAALTGVLRETGTNDPVEIEKLPTSPYYQLSYNQKRLWIINQMDPGSPAYNMPGRVTLEHEVNPQHVRKTVEELTRRHEGLRTSFITVKEEPMQVIGPDCLIHFETEDISAESGKEELRDRIYEKFSRQVFDLATAPLLKVKLIKLSDQLYDLVFVMHHIISDGWSMEILQREFYQIFLSVGQGKDHGLELLPVQYKDYAAWHNKMLGSEKMQRALEYWKGVLGEGEIALELPRDNTSAGPGDSAGFRMVIKRETVDSLKTLAGKNNASLFMMLLAGFNAWMSRLTGQDEITVGMASAGREHQSLKNILGFFINTVVLKNKVETSLTFTHLAGTTRDQTLKALEYQGYPLELVVDKLKVGYPKISVFLNMLNLGQEGRGMLKDTGNFHLNKVQDAKFELAFYFTEYANGVEVDCSYKKNVFKQETVQYICEQYLGLLDRIALDPGKRIYEYFETKKRLIRK